MQWLIWTILCTFEWEAVYKNEAGKCGPDDRDCLQPTTCSLELYCVITLY